jgi:hypothetical protein
MEPQATTDVSDYIAALKRRRRMLAYIVVPIAAIAIGLSLGLPDRFSSASLFTFTQADVPGELPTRGRQEKEYADQYVASLRDTVLAPDRLAAALKKPDAWRRIALPPRSRSPTPRRNCKAAISKTRST